MKRILFVFISFLCVASAFSIEAYDLTCEMQQVPLAIDTQLPRFGWKLKSDTQGDMQLAYQLIVNDGKTKVWDSGKVKSDQSQFVIYNGKTLAKGKRYHWTLKVWDSKGKQSSESASYFDTAPDLAQSKAKWIGAITREDSHLPIGRRNFHGPSFKNKENKDIYDNINPLALKSILLRKNFDASKPIEKAIVHVSGLGHYNLSINGTKVSKDLFTHSLR